MDIASGCLQVVAMLEVCSESQIYRSEKSKFLAYTTQIVLQGMMLRNPSTIHFDKYRKIRNFIHKIGLNLEQFQGTVRACKNAC